jgi:primosomal protein N' (replication factor Y) (superfamily II helicase)
VSSVVKVEPLTTARALRGPFDYLRPEGAGVGSLLDVPFGRQRLRGVVTGIAADSPHTLVAPLRVHDDTVSPELVDLALWLAREYCSTPARALSLVLPPGGARERTVLHAEPTGRDDGRRVTDAQRALLDSLPRAAGADLAALRRLEARGFVRIGPQRTRRVPTHADVERSASVAPPLTGAQAEAVAAIAAGGPGDRLLLHGVTGSGKTEVYLHAAAAVLDAGRTVIVLVPEIALTPQIVSRFVARFGDTVAVLHSRLSAGERYDEWRRLRDGEARVCVGPRSAVFAPLDDVGLVIVDEEHDPSYKNEGDPRYDARRVAERRARGGVLVCGSATPRPESMHALRRLRLQRRVDGAPLPPVDLVDMRAIDGTFAPLTHQAIVDADKTIVMLNRRGWSNFLTCRTCGHVWECPSCDVTLVLHRAQNTIACHHCGHREPIPRDCPKCASVTLARHGAGTERLEAELGALGHEVFRLDADIAHAGPVLAAFARARRGVLVGTQLVAKGHDFPDVALGVVLDADATLRFPDFRAEERTFALVTQLAGRAGRGTAGRVLVQTIDPDAPALVLAARHDADAFAAQELARRRALRYPPFSTLIRVVTSSPDADAAMAAGRAVREPLGAGALGPAPLFRLRGRERCQVVVKAADREPAIAAVRDAVAATAGVHRGVSFSVDVDPQ